MVIINYTTWGLANNFGSYIEMNRNFLKYPKLHAQVLDHELRHNKDKNNFWIDLKDAFTTFLPFKIFGFSFLHPQAIRDLSPVVKSNGVYYVDKPLLFTELFILTIIFLTWRFVI